MVWVPLLRLLIQLVLVVVGVDLGRVDTDGHVEVSAMRCHEIIGLALPSTCPLLTPWRLLWCGCRCPVPRLPLRLARLDMVASGDGLGIVGAVSRF